MALTVARAVSSTDARSFDSGGDDGAGRAAAGPDTETVKRPVRPSDSAVSVAVPGASAWITPPGSTEATSVRSELQTTSRPRNSPPRASTGVAVARNVSPTVMAWFVGTMSDVTMAGSTVIATS